jgi:hypothetical protein
MAKDDEIARKLDALEASMDTGPGQLAPLPKQTDLRAKRSSVESDLNILIGAGLLLTGVLVFANHVKVGTSLLAMLGFGQQGIGFTLIPLLIGLGIIFYDYKNRWGWVCTAASAALIFFAIISSLVMYFPSTSLLGTVIMLLPLAAGAAFLLKGIKQQDKGKSESGD